MPNEDQKPSHHSSAFSISQQQPYSNIDNLLHSFALTLVEFVSNLFGANLGMPEATYAYMQSMYPSYHHNDANNSSLCAALGSFTPPSFNLNISQDMDESLQQTADNGQNATWQQQQLQNPPRNRRRRQCGTGHHYGD